MTPLLNYKLGLIDFAKLGFKSNESRYFSALYSQKMSPKKCVGQANDPENPQVFGSFCAAQPNEYLSDRTSWPEAVVCSGS